MEQDISHHYKGDTVIFSSSARLCRRAFLLGTSIRSGATASFCRHTVLYRAPCLGWHTFLRGASVLYHAACPCWRAFLYRAACFCLRAAAIQSGSPGCLSFPAAGKQQQTQAE